MKIALINGGLGNQIFQYIFARNVELYTGEQCWLDDTYFFLPHDHNGYEIETLFGVKTNRLSEYFDKDVWSDIVENVSKGFSVAQQFKESGNDLFLVAETSDFKFDGNYIYTPANKCISEILSAHGNVYYHGYWICKGWLDLNRKILLKELTFPKITDSTNLNIEEKIRTSNSISIHIRRGDFVKLGWALNEGFYKDAIVNLENAVLDGQYFLFSDDIDWCLNNKEALGLNLIENRLTTVRGNTHGRNYIDMQLMSMCKGMIIANSSFSYVAALMNSGLKWLVNPTPAREV